MASEEALRALKRLELAAQSGDPQDIIDVIAAEKWALWILPDIYPTAKKIVSDVPPAMIADDPLLRIEHPLASFAGRMKALSGHTPRPRPSKPKEFAHSGELLVEVVTSRMAGDFASSVRAAEELSACMSKEMLRSDFGTENPAPLCLLYVGITFILAGDVRRAVQTLTLARDLAPGTAHAYVYQYACGNLAIIHALRGNLDDAQRMLDRSLADSRTPEHMAGFIDLTHRVARAMIAVEQVSSDAGASVDELPGTDAVSELWPLIAYTKARFALSQDKPSEALEITQHALLARPVAAESLASELLTSIELDALVACDALERAAALVDTADCSAPRIALSRARFFIWQGLNDNAALVLHELQNSDIDPVERLATQLLVAELEHANGLAMRPALAQAIAGQARRGCRWRLTRTPALIVTLIAEALPPNERRQFESTIIGCESDLPDPPQAELTRSELSVLRAVGMTSTLSQAAEVLHLSRNTVKTHLSSTYRKLGVSSKVDALRVAAALGIISDRRDRQISTWDDQRQIPNIASHPEQASNLGA